MIIRTHYYQQFDADFEREVPAEGYGGWKSADLPLAPEHTAVALMHAWNSGDRDEYPGEHRVVEYFPRAKEICQRVFPLLLDAVRKSPIRLIHIVSGPSSSYSGLPGYRRVEKLAGPEPEHPEPVASDPCREELGRFRSEHGYVGSHNSADVVRFFDKLDFAPEARPVGDEPIAATSRQVSAWCRSEGVNHLIYAGFAINWCILLSPGGMADMSREGILCSVLRQAVTAVENKETARSELAKQLALWRVALAFGFVYDVDEFISKINL